MEKPFASKSEGLLPAAFVASSNEMMVAMRTS
jgi:hypothetical protein